MKRVLAFALVLLMLLPMAIACKKDENEEKPTGEVTLNQSGESGNGDLLSTIPVANYNGREFNIVVENVHKNEVYAEQVTGDVIHDATYHLLQKINEQYGVSVKAKVPDGDFFSWQDGEAASGKITTSIYGVSAFNLHRSVSSKNLKNWYKMGNMIDLSADRWDRRVNDGITFNGVLYGLTGDLGYSKVQNTMATVYNVALLNQVSYNMTNMLYKMVEDKEWTFAQFETIAKGIYADSDRNARKSGGDTFGYVATTGPAHDIWFEQFGIFITQKNDTTHELVPTLYNEKNDLLINKLWSFLHENQGVWGELGYGTECEIFLEGRAAMVTVRFSEIAQIAKSLTKKEYGLLPAPMLDKNQDDYYTKLYDGFVVWGVSKNISAADVDFTAHITDALCAESSQTVYPKIYDACLANRYSADPATNIYGLLEKVYKLHSET